MERVIVPKNNFLVSYIVSNILKRIDSELKNKVSKSPFNPYGFYCRTQGYPLSPILIGGGPFDSISSDFQQMQKFRRSQIWGDPYIPSIIITFLGQILQSDLIEVRECEEEIRNGVCLDIECF